MNASKEQKETLTTANRNRVGLVRDPLSWTRINFVTALFLSALTVWAAQPVPPPVNLESIEMIPRLKITGTVGALFRIEFRDDLMQTSNWITLQNLVLPYSPFLFIDTNVSSKVRRFYRVSSEPRPPQLVWIAPGNFTLGSPIIEDDRFIDEGPQTAVTISKGFWMGKYEINQAEYMAVMGTDPSAFPDDLTRPVDNVTWNDATNYCAKLTEQERQAGRLPTGYAYRLPTEAEWEYACRAGTTTVYSWGNDPAPMRDYAWYEKNSDFKYQKVGRKKPNPWGLYDMHGNVAEWCFDQYVPNYEQFASTMQVNPWVKSTTPYPHVARGGSWDDTPEALRSAARRASDKSWKIQDPQLPKSIWYHTDAQFLGFRIVRPVELPPIDQVYGFWNTGVEKD